MIKVLLVDDQKVIREQLKSYFEPAANLQVVDTAKDSIEALAKIKTLRPDVVLMDVEMPETDGISDGSLPMLPRDWVEATSSITTSHGF